MLWGEREGEGFVVCSFNHVETNEMWCLCFSPSDKSVLATVANNIPSARREQNLMEARKKLKAASQIESSKLTIRQRRTLMLNQVSFTVLI